MDVLTLRRGPLGAVVAPAAGGALARVWLDAAGGPLELLRPAPPAALERGDAWAMASFPLVPWSNRIRGGRFAFAGRTVALAPNLRGHAIHGLGFRSPWTVTARDAAWCLLEQQHAPGEWPWAYRATQRIALTADGLVLELAVASESQTPMPLGLGWHPYFPRTAQTTLTARATGLWLTDAEVLPTELVPPVAERDPARGLAVDRVALDNAYVGWNGTAVIAWPERRARLRLATDGPLGTLIVYTPPGESFFCAEPVSHITDAFNLATAGRADTGMLILAPGESVRASLTLTPETT